MLVNKALLHRLIAWLQQPAYYDRVSIYGWMCLICGEYFSDSSLPRWNLLGQAFWLASSRKWQDRFRCLFFPRRTNYLPRLANRKREILRYATKIYYWILFIYVLSIPRKSMRNSAIIINILKIHELPLIEGIFLPNSFNGEHAGVTPKIVILQALKFTIRFVSSRLHDFYCRQI